jgi:hypothetical protein
MPSTSLAVHQHHQLVRLQKCLLRAEDHPNRVRRGGNPIADEADDSGTLPAQSLREPVRHVAQALSHRTDALARLRADPRAFHVVERHRDGGDRDSRRPGDVGDSHLACHAHSRRNVAYSVGQTGTDSPLLKREYIERRPSEGRRYLVVTWLLPTESRNHRNTRRACSASSAGPRRVSAQTFRQSLSHGLLTGSSAVTGSLSSNARSRNPRSWSCGYPYASYAPFMPITTPRSRAVVDGAAGHSVR